MTIDTSVTIDKALHLIANLQQNLEQARKENRHLRRRTEGAHPYHYNTAPRILRRALDDALAIVLLRTNGYNVGRGFCYELGISERRYFWAMGLLRSARVVSARGSAWLVDDFTSAETKVKREYERIKPHANALEQLRLYMPKKMAHVYSGVA